MNDLQKYINKKVKCIDPDYGVIEKDQIYFIVDSMSESHDIFVKVSLTENGKQLSDWWYIINRFELIEEENEKGNVKWMI